MTEKVEWWKGSTSLIERATLVLYRCEKEPSIMQDLKDAIRQSDDETKKTVDLLIDRGMLVAEERADKRKVYKTTEQGHRIKTKQLPLIFEFQGESWARRVHSFTMREILQRYYQEFRRQRREMKGEIT